MAAASRSPEIMADAAAVILNKPAREFTGRFLIDEEVLREEGVEDFSIYASDPDGKLVADFFVPDEIFERLGNKVVAFKDMASLL